MTTLNLQPHQQQQQQQDQSQGVNDDGHQWRSLVDPRTGAPYYCNVKTGKTQWTRPPDCTLIMPFLPSSNNGYANGNSGTSQQQQHHGIVVRNAIAANVNALTSSPTKNSSLDTAVHHHRNLIMAASAATASTSATNGGLFLLASATSPNNNHATNGLTRMAREAQQQLVQHQNRNKKTLHHQVHPSSPTTSRGGHMFLGSEVLGAEAQERYRLPIQPQLARSSDMSLVVATPSPSSSTAAAPTPTSVRSSTSGLHLPGGQQQQQQQPSPSLLGRVQETTTTPTTLPQPQLISSQPQPLHREPQLPTPIVPTSSSSVAVTASSTTTLGGVIGKPISSQPQLIHQQHHQQPSKGQLLSGNQGSSGPKANKFGSELMSTTLKASSPPKLLQLQHSPTTTRTSFAATTVASAARMQLGAGNMFETVDKTDKEKKETDSVAKDTSSPKPTSKEVVEVGKTSSSSSSSSTSLPSLPSPSSPSREERMVWVKFGKSSHQLAYLLSIDGNNKGSVRWESTKLKEEVSLDRIEEMDPANKRCRRASSSDSFASSPPVTAPTTPTSSGSTSSKGKVLPSDNNHRNNDNNAVVDATTSAKTIQTSTAPTSVAPSTACTFSCTPPCKTNSTIAKITPEEQPPTTAALLRRRKTTMNAEAKDDAAPAEVKLEHEGRSSLKEEGTALDADMSVKPPPKGGEAGEEDSDREKQEETVRVQTVCESPRKGKDIAALVRDKPMESLTSHMDQEEDEETTTAAVTSVEVPANDAIMEVDKHEEAVLVEDTGTTQKAKVQDLAAEQEGPVVDSSTVTKDAVSGADEKSRGELLSSTATASLAEEMQQIAKSTTVEEETIGVPPPLPRKATTGTKNFFEAVMDEARGNRDVAVAQEAKEVDDEHTKATKVVAEDDVVVVVETEGTDESEPRSKKQKTATAASGDSDVPGPSVGITIIFNKEEGSKLGVSLTAMKERIFITKVEEGGLIANTELKVGMEIHSINNVLVPTTLEGAAKMFMEATGIVTVVAFKGTLMPLLQCEDHLNRHFGATAGVGGEATFENIDSSSSTEAKAEKDGEAEPMEEEPKPTSSTSTTTPKPTEEDSGEPEEPDSDAEEEVRPSRRRSSKATDDDDWEPERASKRAASTESIATRRSRRSSKSLYRVEVTPGKATPKSKRGRPKKTNSNSTTSSTKGSTKKRKRDSAGKAANSNEKSTDEEEIQALKVKHVGEIERVVTRQQAELERIRQREMKAKQKEFEQYEAEREASLEQWEATLEERETTLEERETSLQEKAASLGKKAATLERVESSLEQKKASLDLKEKDVMEREAELDSYSAGTVEPYEAVASEPDDNESDATNMTSEPSTVTPSDATEANSGLEAQQVAAPDAATATLPLLPTIGETTARSEDNNQQTEKIAASSMTVLSSSAVAVLPADVRSQCQEPSANAQAGASTTSSIVLPQPTLAPAGAVMSPQPAAQVMSSPRALALPQLSSTCVPPTTPTFQKAAKSSPVSNRDRKVKSPKSTSAKKKKVKTKKSLKSPKSPSPKTTPVSKPTPKTTPVSKTAPVLEPVSTRKKAATAAATATATANNEKFPQPVAPPVAKTSTVVKPTKKDAVFGRGRKKSHVRTDNLYRELIESNCNFYSTLDVSKYDLRRKFVKEKIIDPILKCQGRFIMRMGADLKLLDVNDKTDLRLIYKKIQRALFNERKRREYMGPPTPNAGKTSTPKAAKKGKNLPQHKEEEDEVEEEAEEEVSADASKRGDDALDGAGIEGFEDIDMMTEENENSVFNLGFSFDDDLAEEDAIGSADSVQEDNESSLVESMGSAPTEARAGDGEVEALRSSSDTALVAETLVMGTGEAFDNKGTFENDVTASIGNINSHEPAADMAMIAASGAVRAATLAETTQQQMMEIATATNLEMQSMLSRMWGTGSG